MGVGSMSQTNFYETDRAVAEYLHFHYGSRESLMPWDLGPAQALDYPTRCVTECLDPSILPGGARALDLGCAVGRSSFELARHCQEVVGIDFSHRFIQAAQTLAEGGTLTYSYLEEGTARSEAVARVPEGVDASRVTFQQGDATALPADLGTFDVLLMANLIDRLPDPMACLRQLPGLVRPGGQVILTSPYTWLEEYTPRSAWLGGESSEVGGTLAALRAALEPDFELAETKQLPFLIREHRRKYQWSVAEGSLWRRLKES